MKVHSESFWRNEALLIFVFSFLLALILILPSNPYDHLPGQDNGVFLYGGDRLLSGEVPYRDFWDHKGPVIYIINAIGLFLAGGSRWGVWLLESFFLFVTGLGIYELSRAQRRSLASLITLIVWFYLMKQVGSYYHFGDSNFIESYGLLFNIWGIVFWLRANVSDKSPYKYLFLIGVMAGFSFLLRPNNIAAHVSIVVLELLSSWRDKRYKFHLLRVGAIVAGGLGVLTIFSLIFLRLNAFFQFFDALFTYNVLYSNKNIGLINNWGMIVFGLKKLFWLPVIAPLFIVFELISKKDLNTDSELPRWNIRLLLLLWIIFEVVFTSLSGRALLHYYINWTLVTSLVIMNGLDVLGERLFKGYDRSYKLNENPGWRVPAVILFFLMVNLPMQFYGVRLVGSILSMGELEPKKSLIEYIKNNSDPSDKVLVWGNDVWINFLSKRASPSKYAYQYALFLPGYTDNEKISSFVAELENCKPVLIVAPYENTDEILPLIQSRRLYNGTPTVPAPPGIEKVYDFFDDHYEFVRDFNGVEIYKLKGEYDQHCK